MRWRGKESEEGFLAGGNYTVQIPVASHTIGVRGMTAFETEIYKPEKEASGSSNTRHHHSAGVEGQA